MNRVLGRYSRMSRRRACGEPSAADNDGGVRMLFQLMSAPEIALMLAIDPAWRLPRELDPGGGRMLAAREILLHGLAWERTGSASACLRRHITRAERMVAKGK